MEDDDFETGEAAGSATYPKQCSALRNGDYIVIKDRPCKISNISTSKTGKHGAAKAHITACDVFTGKKCDEIASTTSNVLVPNVSRKDYQLVDIRDGFFSFMGDDMEIHEHVPVPNNDVGKEIMSKWEAKGGDDFVTLTVIKAMGEEMAVGIRTATQ